MGYRNIFIANTARLSAKNEQLIVNSGEVFSFPLEDIRCVLIEDTRTTVSTALLAKFAEAGIAVLICNSNHLPTASLQPINSYSRQLKQIKLQINASVPLKKRLWQKIVKSKIINQSKCLELTDNSGADLLENLSEEVKSGDPANIEGRAAAHYFRNLFEKEFKRSDDTVLNAMLNYGYAIVRAYICRTICLYGFEPSLGIHHCSELNNFNLADDIIEPFRPLVDLYISKRLNNNETFSTVEKTELLKILNTDVRIDNKRYSASNAIELVVQSYSDCLKNGAADIKLPVLTDISFGSYE